MDIDRPEFRDILEGTAEPSTRSDASLLAWQGYNHSECDKCRLTIFLLMTLGLNAKGFQYPPNRKDVLPGPIGCRDDYFYALQNLTLARTVGDGALITFLERRLQGYRWRKTLKALDHAFMGARLHSLARWIGNLQRRSDR